MNTFLVFVHAISMFLAFAGGVMLAVWLFKNLKAKELLIVIVVTIVVGLLGSYLTFQNWIEFHSLIFRNSMMNGEHMMNMGQNMMDGGNMMNDGQNMMNGSQP